MATTRSHWDSEVPVGALDGAVDPYAKDKKYLVIFLVLFVITALEVSTYFIEGLTGVALVGALLTMAAVKFVLVASFFMHLKYDRKLLSTLFYSGLVLAIVVFLAVLTAFRVWWPNHHAVCDSSPVLKKGQAVVQSHTECPPPNDDGAAVPPR